MGGPAQPGHARRGSHVVDAVGDARQKGAVTGGEHAATEHDVDVAAREPQAAQRRDDHGDDLVGLPVDEALGDGVTLSAAANTTGASSAG